MFPASTRILIVDDIPSALSILKASLGELGYREISEAENGELALSQLSLAEGLGEPIDLIIADWNMPVMSGIQLLEKVRNTSDYKHLPFILVTAKGEAANVMQAIKLGVSEYLIKPTTTDALKAKLASTWNRTQKG